MLGILVQSGRWCLCAIRPVMDGRSSPGPTLTFDLDCLLAVSPSLSLPLAFRPESFHPWLAAVLLADVLPVLSLFFTFTCPASDLYHGLFPRVPTESVPTL